MKKLFESVYTIGAAYLQPKRNVAYNFHLELINRGSLQRKWTAFVSPARNLQLRHTGLAGILGENIAPICALQLALPHQKLLKSAAKWARINNCIYTKYSLQQNKVRILRAKARRDDAPVKIYFCRSNNKIILIDHIDTLQYTCVLPIKDIKAEIVGHDSTAYIIQYLLIIKF